MRKINKKGTYQVSIPIAGSVTVKVEAESSDEAVEKSWDAAGELSREDLEDALQWEYHELICSGSVLYVSQNEIEVKFLGASE